MESVRIQIRSVICDQPFVLAISTFAFDWDMEIRMNQMTNHRKTKMTPFTVILNAKVEVGVSRKYDVTLGNFLDYHRIAVPQPNLTH